MLAAQMDALALFHDRVHGLNADASGLITLLAVAAVLSEHAQEPANAKVRVPLRKRVAGLICAVEAV